MYNLLLVDDDLNLCDSLQEIFKSPRYRTTVANNGINGLKLARTYNYDLLILDVNLPGQSGLRISEALRSDEVETPILMLSGRAHTEDIVEGLKLGADDYVCKPFNFRELIARAEGLLQRPPSSRQTVLRYKDLSLDTNTGKIFRDGNEILLRKREFEILEYFLRNQGKLLRREQIQNNIFPLNQLDPFSSALDVHISNIRRRLRADGKFKEEIVMTRHGYGYGIGF